MSSAQHPSLGRTGLNPPTHPGTSSTPSRRALLRGGMVLGATAAAAAFTTRQAPAGPLPLAGYPDVEWVPAHESNYNSASRPGQSPVNLVIIHVTQGSYAGTLKHFQNASADVSAHYVVRSGDGHIARMVREKDIAWHAGNKDYNARSIGIEHEGFVDDPKWFTDELYASSAALTAAVCDHYGIPRDREHILGHAQVPGSDHTDPGPHWDWDRYLKLIARA